MSSPTPLEEGGILLRFPEEADRAPFIALRQANAGHLERWEPLPPPGADDSVSAKFDRLMQTSDSEASKRLLVALTTHAAIAGAVSLGGIQRGPLQQGYLGYWLGREFEGRGVMSRAIRLALRYAFSPEKLGGLGLHRVECNVMPGNTRSLATARRAGFREEGYSPRYLQIAGRWEDHVRFAMTVEDWLMVQRPEGG
ncbi:MAG: GNAT family protein [Phycisphaerales bacterium]